MAKKIGKKKFVITKKKFPLIKKKTIGSGTRTVWEILLQRKKQVKRNKGIFP